MDQYKAFDVSGMFIQCPKQPLERYLYMYIYSIWNIPQDFDTCEVTDLFSILHTTPFLYVKVYFGVLHKYGVDVTRVQYPVGFKPATSSGRSIQIASNLARS